MVKAVGRLRMRQHPSKVFSVPFVHNRRCQRVQCKRSLQIAERRGGRLSQKEQFHSGQCLDARRRLKERFNYFGGEPKENESRKARGNAAERQRSRSEADTGRRTGASFGLNLLAVLRAVLLRPFRVARAEASRSGGTHSVFYCQPLP